MMPYGDYTVAKIQSNGSSDVEVFCGFVIGSMAGAGDRGGVVLRLHRLVTQRLWLLQNFGHWTSRRRWSLIAIEEKLTLNVGKLRSSINTVDFS
uniref:Uncharacterized protein n=1 Tax=Kalanchoe fedtschenkoi TaxID=63787 RepID=A0A7N0T763_KALFE